MVRFVGEVRMDAKTVCYEVSVAGLEDWPGVLLTPAHLPFPDSPTSSEHRPPGTGSSSGSRLEAMPQEKTPTRPAARKSRWNERQRRMRGLDLVAYAKAYMVEKALCDSTRSLVADCLGHISRAKGLVWVKSLTTELLYEMRDYFLGLIAEGEISPATANKHLRQLQAIANHAASDRLVSMVRFRKFLIEPRPNPTAWTLEQYDKIEAAARKVTGSVGNVLAAVWWLAWWLTISRAGCRVSAMMLARRTDYENKILWLRAENQKQDQDQRIALGPHSCRAIEDLLAAHDDERLFPWPHDEVKPGKKTNWKTLYKHFQKHLLDPCGIKLPRGIKTRMCRRTAATIVNESGGSGQRLCGHSSDRITKKHYIPRNRVPVTRDALLIPDFDSARQLDLFEKEAG